MAKFTNQSTVASSSIFLDVVSLMIKTPPLKSTPTEASDLSALAIEIWRLQKTVSKLNKQDDVAQTLSNSFEKLYSYLRKQNVEIIDFTGKKHSDGLNLDVLSYITENLEEPMITETIEPTIKINGVVIKRAKVIVTK